MTAREQQILDEAMAEFTRRHSGKDTARQWRAHWREFCRLLEEQSGDVIPRGEET